MDKIKKSKFLTNEKGQTLLDRFKQVLPSHTQNFDVLVGYFRSSGFKQLSEALKNVKKIRILVGINIDKQLYDALTLENQETNLEENKKLAVNQFIEWKKQGKIEIKAYPYYPIHAKMYILHYDKQISDIIEGQVITGSSNFTQSGLHDNIEINVQLSDPEDYYWAKNKFEELWAQSKDITEKYIEAIQKVSKFVCKTPYEIFIKSLYELQKEEAINAFTKDEEKREGSKVELTEFQKDAVSRVMVTLKKFNSVLVADSVGLGKTWIAKRIAEEFGYYRRNQVLVICPAQLSEMWRKEIKSINVAENILSQEKLANMKNVQEEFKKELGKELTNLSLVIIDESHNFRNPLSNRHENFANLIDFLKQNNLKLKIIFMTATPINNSIWDLYWQLYLLLGDNKAFLGYGITDLFRHFKKVEKEEEKLGDILHLISLRRNRNYIEDNYPQATINGQLIKFPDRKLENIEYRLKDIYKGMYGEIAQMIKESEMAYYRFTAYKKELTEKDKEELQRMTALSGIFRTILLKRLESSVEAFRKSINEHKKFLLLVKELVQQGKILTKKTYYKIVSAYEDEEINLQTIIIRPEVESFVKDSYKIDEFINDLDKDIKRFNEMDQKVSTITIKDDAKIRKLEEKLKTIKKDEQVVVFSYYVDTLNYIFNYFKDNQNLKELVLEKISGRTSTESRQTIVEKFANKEINILFSTDVLSEGQNLQTAQTLINYDLHWNPTRMIQRAGRIDRIGSRFPEIYIYNFFPEKELEDLLRLMKILQDKIKNIDDQVGLDQTILGEKIHPKVFGTLVRLKNKDEKVLDEQEDEAFGGGRDVFWEPLRDYYLKHKSFEKTERLPFESFSGIRKGNLKGIYFYYQYDNENHYWFIYDIRTKNIIRNKESILEFIQAKEEGKIYIPDWQKEFYEVKKLIENEIESQYAQESLMLQKGKRNEFKNREEKFVLDGLRLLQRQIQVNELTVSEEDKKREMIELKLYKIRKTKKVINDLRRAWRSVENKEIDWRQILHKWYEILKDKITFDIATKENFDKSKLKLVTYEFIS
jgi:superfamily II DNA or RNA helicase